MLAWFSAQERRKKKSHVYCCWEPSYIDVSGFLCAKIPTDVVEGDDIAWESSTLHT